jgi:hypothetical protein
VATAVKDIRRSRTASRKRVLMTGTLVTADGNQRVRIHDISATGAHVSSEGPLKTKVDVLLKKSSIAAAAWVAWSEEKSAGLKFYRELAQDELASIFHRD